MQVGKESKNKSILRVFSNQEASSRPFMSLQRGQNSNLDEKIRKKREKEKRKKKEKEYHSRIFCNIVRSWGHIFERVYDFFESSLKFFQCSDFSFVIKNFHFEHLVLDLKKLDCFFLFVFESRK